MSTSAQHIKNNLYIVTKKIQGRMSEETIWFTVVSTVVGSITTALLYRSLVKAKVKSIIAETYDQLIETLTKQVNILQGDVERLRNRLDHLTMKELQYLEQITALTKERNTLQIQILEKDGIIEILRKKLLPSEDLDKTKNNPHE